jgi:hypothetical protein
VRRAVVTAAPRALDLDELEAAHGKATPGPWQVDDDGSDCAVTAGTARGLPGSWRATDRIYTVDVGEWSGETEDEAVQRQTDAALIVAAVNALPDLIAELRKHRAAVQAVETLARGWRSTASPLGLQLAGDDLHLVLSSAFGAEGADRG